MALPALDPASSDATGHHLLVLPADVGHEEVETLALSRFARAAWEVQPSSAAPRPSGGARALRALTAAPGVLRLSRHSTLVGPFTLDRVATGMLGVPPSAGIAYVVHAPVERGDKPWPGGGDRDGLRRAFPAGLPVRDEERTVAWLIAAARRLGGAVRTTAAGGSPATLLVPDPAAAVDLTVWTDIWLEPEATLTVMRQALPRAYLNLPKPLWNGPPRGVGERPVRGAEVLTPEQRRSLHAAAEEYDVAALTNPEPMRGYGALADLELDGMVALEVSGETRPPPVIESVPWAARGAVAYRVRWEPPDLADREAERPSLEHRVARGRATPLVIALTRAVHKAVGGEITDLMDFVVDPADL
ncbi:hypothetical protein [Actinotalea subterranea]|uniref:hypothetical protein n=1 Tax=Actinotalea subterranea TaxID=2607497 RepID=UPI0011EF77A5|nr:hypothetical protein [Actinotalea subterranea]